MTVAAARRRRRKLTYRAAVLKLDPRATITSALKTLGGRFYDHYEVRDGAGVLIGWNDGNEAGPTFAWACAYSTLTRRQNNAEVAAQLAKQ